MYGYIIFFRMYMYTYLVLINKNIQFKNRRARFICGRDFSKISSDHVATSYGL